MGSPSRLEEHANWIAGEARGAAACFERAGALWPRSGAAEVREALAALERPAMPVDLAAARARLAAAPPPLVEALGWSPAEWREHLAEPDAGPGTLAPETSGVVVVAPHASELVRAPAERVFARLARGERVLFLAPAHCPWMGELLAQALHGAGAAFALLHDDGLDALRAALARPEVGAVDFSAPPARVRAASLDTTVRLLRNRTLVVEAAHDPEAAARAAVRLAFGRVAALSGQRAGALGRVVCHERLFSRFSAALLAELESSAEVAGPVAFLESETEAHLESAWDLGLDEGATPIFVRRDPPAYVFTNVDARMQLAPLARCAPLLCLLRAESDAEARARAAELDGDPRAEDLAP